jgi:DNA-binding CsgD family transcriptional regulator
MILSAHDAVDAQGPSALLDVLQNAVEPAVNVVGVIALRGEESKDWPDGFSRIAHSSVSERFLAQFRDLSIEQQGPDLLLQAALTSSAPYTFTEVMRRLQPVGKDRRVFEVMQDNGIRDGFCCPAGPCLVTYWSPHVLRLDQTVRWQLEANSSIVAVRAQEFMVVRPAEKVELSPRELAILRQLAIGKHLPEAAEYLGVSIHTARTLQRRAQKKLNARTPLQAAVRAVRHGLI